MLVQCGLFSCGSISAGHPDKLCDCISAAILDEFRARDPHARVAGETFAHGDTIIVAGEFRTCRDEDFAAVRDRAASITRATLKETGNGCGEQDIDPSRC